MLSKDAVGEGVLVLVLLVDRTGVAPSRGAVFLTAAVVAAGRKVNPDAQPVGTDKKEDSFYTVLTPGDAEGIVQRPSQVLQDFRQTAVQMRGGQQRQPDHRQ